MNLSISMNNGMNNAMHATASPRAASGAADAPTAGVAPDGSGVLPSAELASVPQAMPFQQWIAADAPLPEFVSVPAAEGAPVDSVAPAQPTDQEDQDDPAGLAVGADQSAVFDTRFTTMAMAMALPISPAAMPAMMMAMAGTKTDAANDGTGTTAGTPVGMPAAVAAAGAGIASPASTVLTALTESRAVGASPALADAAASPAPTARVLATPALPDTAAGAESARSERIEAAPASAASVIAGTAIQPAPARGADSLTLTGPPSAWRQSLHEALGERLQLQIGRNAEQATIRLDPPMLGRIDISVRHSGGNLEVHIAATNTEVLRQLNTVSDSLRNDLAGRQYSNVSVNVTEAPRAQASTQAGNQPSGQPGADAQGRGRQQEQEQARTPGLALNDAGEAGSLFSLYARD